MSAADKAKLDGISAGAEANVQSDWAQTDNTKDDFIKGKPATFTPPVATAAVLGGIKAGTGVAIAADGTLSVSLTGGMAYKGTTDPTAAPPASSASGDVWIASKGGAYNAGWKLTGTATEGELLIWQGTKWDVVGQSSAPVKPDWNAAAGAADEILNKPTIPTVPGAATGTTAGLMSAADKAKLDLVGAGAQANVKPDWNAAGGSAAEILNKPTIPTVTKPDWNAAGGTAAEILNKPTIPAAPADASDTVKGVVELATAAETTAGTDATKAVTPAGLKVELDKLVPRDLTLLPDLP